MENNNEKKIKLTWNKKVISISFLVLALFMLLAVSYAYFTATVEGNEDAESITVEAAKMSLKLTGPTEVSLPNALPGTEVKSEFTVTNTGTVQTTYNLDMIDVTNNFDPASDLVYSITSTNDGGHAENVIAPTESQTLIRNILIQPGEENAQVYTLTVRFRETGVDQNSNQGKKFSGRVQINNLTDNSLAAAILRANPIQSSDDIDFYNGSPYHNYYNDTHVKNGDGLFTAPDNDGASYYFRGDITNNNVRFANMDWKILRINGDGSIRLILTDDTVPKESSAYNINGSTEFKNVEFKYVGYTYNNAHDCTQSNPCVSDYDVDNANFKYNYKNSETEDSTIKGALEKWYNNKLSSYDSQIALTTYCNDTSITRVSQDRGGTVYYYGVHNSRNPNLTCSNPTEYESEETHNYGGVYKLKIGLITFDENIFVGGSGHPDYGQEYYLRDIVVYTQHIWSMSPSDGGIGDYIYPGVYGTNSSEYPHLFSPELLDSNLTLVPVINLKPDVTFSGTGTEDAPYTIN